MQPAKARLVIHTDHASKEIQELGEDESYILEISATGAKLSAPTPLGILHGLQTFLQLVDVSPDGFAAPAVTINDKPRFPWRGLMIDSARHFTPLDVLKRNIDGLEAVKMNVFHWHLSENQGFRVESKKFPKLHEMGSDGLYYTQDEIRDLIAYARDRGIRVVPEFDVPGHSTAWFVGYPELASAPGPYEIERKWGVFDPAFDPTNEKVYKFLDQLIEEMAKLFPDHFFHVGGDEVNGKQWDANPKIQEFIKAHDLKNNEGLQAYFNKRLEPIVSQAREKHGRLGRSARPDATEGYCDSVLARARRLGRGREAGLSRNSFERLLPRSWMARCAPLCGGPSERCRGKSLSRRKSANPRRRIVHVVGVRESQRISIRASGRETPLSRSACGRRRKSPMWLPCTPGMDFISDRLEWLGLTHKTYYRQMLHRIAGPSTPEEFAALETLANVVEPVKDYTAKKPRPSNRQAQRR